MPIPSTPPNFTPGAMPLCWPPRCWFCWDYCHHLRLSVPRLVATAAAVQVLERQDSVDGVGEDIAQLVANALFVPLMRYDNAGVQGLVNPPPGENPRRTMLTEFCLLAPSTFPLADQFQFGSQFHGVPAATSSKPNPPLILPESSGTAALADRFVGFDLDQRYGVDPWFPRNFALSRSFLSRTGPTDFNIHGAHPVRGVIDSDTGNTLFL